MPKDYKLVITEKPSVAKTYADILGANKKQDGYYYGNGYLISWCVGHLVELVMPHEYDEKYRRWLTEDLPILPSEWKYQVSASTRKQFKILEKLMKRTAVKEILFATDAGREGELIARLVYLQAGCSKPFKRIWLSSMENAAVREAFAHPRPGHEYDSLFEAARCREQADWIVGINATRLFSCLYKDTLNIGRVMTPTLAMVADRENAISSFVSEPYYVVQITAGGISFDGRKLKKQEDVLKLARACKSAGAVSVQAISVKEKKENPPLLFDLTTLQRESNCRFGFSAQQTLDYAQSLYEKKLLTYPRTDSRYLTSDMEKTVAELIWHTVEPATGIAGEKILNIKPLLHDERVTDHMALLPTSNAAKAILEELPSGEQAILQMVMLRLLAATSVPHVCQETKVVVSCCDEEFTASGRQILEQGWKRYEPDSSKESLLPPLKEGTYLGAEAITVKNGQTKPPARYTEGTLLHAMETAGRESIPEEAEHTGIGTPATRAGIIEKLIRIGFLKRTGEKKTKVLVPTDRGLFLTGVLPEELKSVTMTAEWEKKLLAIEKGSFSTDVFMAEVAAYMQQLIQTEKARPVSPASVHDFKRKGGNSPASSHKKGTPSAKKASGRRRS